MIVSQILYGCDLSYWATNSAIAMPTQTHMPYNLFTPTRVWPSHPLMDC